MAIYFVWSLSILVHYTSSYEMYSKFFQSALAASGIGPGSSGLNSGTSGHLTFRHGGDNAVGGKPGGSGNITPTMASSNKVHEVILSTFAYQGQFTLI